jgi:hypothetical protein
LSRKVLFFSYPHPPHSRGELGGSVFAIEIIFSDPATMQPA